MDVQVFTHPRTIGDLVVVEFDENYCRERGTVLGGIGVDRVIPQFGLVGRVLVASLAVAATKVGTGNGVITGSTVAAGSKPGAYVATCVGAVANGGKFIFEDPDGIELGPIVVGTPFTLGGITATIADGATDWVEGDQVTYTVTATAAALDANGNAKLIQVSQSATDGSQNTIGLFPHAVTATVGNDETSTYLARGPMIVRKEEIAWPAGSNDAQKANWIAQLAALGILVRVSG